MGPTTPMIAATFDGIAFTMFLLGKLEANS